MTINRKNLEVLADYLDNLPEDYEHFDMANFTSIPGISRYTMLDCELTEKVPTLYVNACPAVACAVGHGPAAGFSCEGFVDTRSWAQTAVFNDRGEQIKGINVDWMAYSAEFFVDNEDDKEAWEFMFGGDWSRSDNTLEGAVKRIRYVIEHDDVPSGFDSEYSSTWSRSLYL